MRFFGDGATNQGVWHEANNISKLWQLSVVFVCENNFYGIGTGVRISSSYTDVCRRATAAAPRRGPGIGAIPSRGSRSTSSRRGSRTRRGSMRSTAR